MEQNKLHFPLFIDLYRKPVVVIGAGPIALRRIGVLQTFGANITVIAPEALPLPEGVTWLARAYRPGDLDGAFLAIAATNQRQVNAQVAREARERGVFASIADSRRESTFFFPAICIGGDVVAGVVSDGTKHRKTAQVAKAIREILEDME